MKLLSSIMIAGIALGSVANAEPQKHSLGTLGNLVKNNAKGDYKYSGVSAFTHNGTRAYINHFAKLLAADSGNFTQYQDVMTQGIRVWDEENKPKGFTNDLAGALALFTYTNLALAQNQNYKDYLFPNLVSQYRKALASREIGTMSNAKKQDIYDYLLAESVYMQSLASMGRDKNQDVAAKLVRDTSTYHIRETFGIDPSNLSLSEAGLSFN